jgi:hypothetical protein
MGIVWLARRPWYPRQRSKTKREDLGAKKADKSSRSAGHDWAVPRSVYRRMGRMHLFGRAVLVHPLFGVGGAQVAGFACRVSISRSRTF